MSRDRPEVGAGSHTDGATPSHADGATPSHADGATPSRGPGGDARHPSLTATRADGATPSRGPDGDARHPSLTATRAGRTLGNLVAIALVAAMLVSNLPESALRDRLVAFERPITDVTGLSQSWALFAPTPRSTTLQLRAEIERVDGSVEAWTPPTGGPVLGVYRTYRWRKWAGFAAGPDRTALHRQTVRYLEGATAEDGGPPVTEIRLYRDAYRQPGVGSGHPLDRDPPFEAELLRRRRLPVTDAAAGDALADRRVLDAGPRARATGASP